MTLRSPALSAVFLVSAMFLFDFPRAAPSEATEDKGYISHDLICYMSQGKDTSVPAWVLETAQLEHTWVIWGSVHGAVKGSNEGTVTVVDLGDLSWTEGRNLLFALAKESSRGCTWFVLMDADAHIHYRDTTVRNNNVDENPPFEDETAIEHFDRLLRIERPAAAFVPVGFPRSLPLCPAEYGLRQISSDFDAIVAAYHFETAPLLLPYCSKFELISWHASMAIQNEQLFILKTIHAVEYGHLTVHNTQQSDYPKGDYNLSATREEAERLVEERLGGSCAAELIAQARKDSDHFRGRRKRFYSDPLCQSTWKCCGGADYGVFQDCPRYSPDDIRAACAAPEDGVCRTRPRS